LLFVRHGQTSANILGSLDSRTPGPALTALGERQAQALVVALREQPITSIYASTMTRTAQTAAPLAAQRGLEVRVLAGLREIEAGELELRTDVASLMTYGKTVMAWAAGDLGPRLPGGGDGHEFFARFDAAIEEVLREGGPSPVIFNHGGAIRVWVPHRCENVPGTYGAEHELHNTGAVSVERTAGGGFRMARWHAEPMGGAQLEDPAAEDPNGESMAGVVSRRVEGAH
jgi:probable phosphoglycerate mutase